jgi:hypothetical protein
MNKRGLAAGAVEPRLITGFGIRHSGTQWPRWVDFCRSESASTVCRSSNDQATAILRPVTLQESDLSYPTSIGVYPKGTPASDTIFVSLGWIFLLGTARTLDLESNETEAPARASAFSAPH